MKAYLLATSFCLALAGCANKDSEPAPGPKPTGDAWAWASSTLVTTLTNGGTVTTQSKTVLPKTVSLLFTTDGKVILTIDKSISLIVGTTSTTDTYTYSGGVITTTYPSYSETSTVLTDHNLTLVNTDQIAGNKYVTTDTYTC